MLSVYYMVCLLDGVRSFCLVVITLQVPLAIALQYSMRDIKEYFYFFNFHDIK